MIMASAFQWHMNENPKSISDSDMEKMGKVLMGVARFLSDQSYMQGVGDLVKITEGDQYAVGKSAAGFVSQLIPLSGLLRWTNTFIDPFFRKPTKGLSAESIIQSLAKDIPIVSESVPALRDALGKRIERKNQVVNAFSPMQISQAKGTQERIYQQTLSTKRIQEKANKARERILKKTKIR
jgi:hypothetical protein